MGKKLAYTVHVTETKPVDPKKPDGERYATRTEVFERGTELPAWAAAFVHPHVYEEENTLPDPVAPNGKADHMDSPKEPGGEAVDPSSRKTSKTTAEG